MSISGDVLCGKLEALDASVRAAHGPLATLDPSRDVTTPFVVLGQRATSFTDDAATLSAFGEAMVAIVEALCASFPENIFWDMDYLASSLLRHAERSELGAPRFLREAAELLVSLQALYGRSSPIRFRYAHDFLYGFDWARWVRRDPPARAGVEPFDRAFLDYSRTRGHELLALIERDDAKYPSLAPGVARNPFAFSRDPDDERVLHRDLALRACIPVCAWDPNADARWDRPFSDMRTARAEALRLPRRE